MKKSNSYTIGGNVISTLAYTSLLSKTDPTMHCPSENNPTVRKKQVNFPPLQTEAGLYTSLKPSLNSADPSSVDDTLTF